MKNWFLFAFVSVLLLSPLPIEGNNRDDKKKAVVSLYAITNLFMHSKEYEISAKETILIFPVQLATELYYEYDFFEKNRFLEVTNLQRMMYLETNFTYFLEEFYHDFTEATRGYYARTYAYLKFVNSVPVPDRNIAEEESIRFAFRCFVKWYHDHPSATEEAKAIVIPPILTMMTLKIDSLPPETFQWKARVPFYISEEKSIDVWALQSLRTFGYGEYNFIHPLAKCPALALRIRVSQTIAMVFAIPQRTGPSVCNLTSTFVEAIPHADFDLIDFKPRLLFVSIPVIKTFAVLNTIKHLERVGLVHNIDDEFEEFPSVSTRYLSMGLIFDPKGVDSQIRNAIPEDVTRFFVEREFIVAVVQAGNKVPLLLGFVQQPMADVNYDEIEKNINFEYIPRNVPSVAEPSNIKLKPR